MTNKAERLAREIVALRLKYADRDFQDAFSLIGNGPLFEIVVEAVSAAAAKTKKASSQPKRALKISASNADDSSSIIARASTDKNLERFLKRFLDREILNRGASNRAFAQAIGVVLPKSYPARTKLASIFVDKLLTMPEDEREQIIRAAENGEIHSSLALWSNVILRGNPKNR